MELHGAEIINCDLVGHDVYKPGTNCHKLVTEHFGKNILTPDGEINRKELGAVVFNNPVS